MIATKSVVATRGLRAPLGAARPFSGKRQSVVVRFRDNDKPNAAKSDHEQLEKELPQVGNGPKDPKLSPDQFDQVWCCCPSVLPCFVIACLRAVLNVSEHTGLITLRG